ncbi:flagellar basal body L-ring protein FlgH [Salipiger sp. PrR003]|uniref:flagellar basal body L-ring protein FlgH n=1 Tax=Salipiger sp. PrR003 TaxID=2706776 RepID=UPI0013DBC4BD|nr:flagellar basal body L-ring protein FlgH [Salipiger sp. PrR003]NDV50767.1 flagellar basal body L-ring protein FlgH [Salipiger sp. PrR003]
MKHFRISTAATLAALTLSACGLQDVGREPKFSDISVQEDTFPEASHISVPMPEPDGPVRELQRAESTSLWASAGSESFFQDQRASKVGDILTVNIEIKDEASLSNESEVGRSSESQVGFPTFFGYGGKLAEVLPGVGAEDLPMGSPVVDLGSSSSSQGSGSVDRNEKISLKVAAMVIDKLPNGNLVIAGRQEVRVNYELRELRVAGLVRKEDISGDNTIAYDKIAEARIAYGGRGSIARAQRAPYGQQVMDIVLPY